MNFLKNLVLSFILTLCLCNSAVAQASVDTPRYYIMFSARFATIWPFSAGGHAFVTWRKELRDTITKQQITLGFFAAEGNGLLDNTPGKIIPGYIKNSNKEKYVRRCIIEVDSLTYIRSIESVLVWRDTTYSLYNRNCVHFIDGVAREIQLKTPDISGRVLPMKPSIYIKRLVKLNQAKLTSNRYLNRVVFRMQKHERVTDINIIDDDEG
jgi:hypothetical protein